MEALDGKRQKDGTGLQKNKTKNNQRKKKKIEKVV